MTPPEVLDQLNDSLAELVEARRFDAVKELLAERNAPDIAEAIDRTRSAA